MIKYYCNLCGNDITSGKRFKSLNLLSKNTGIEGDPLICCKVTFDENHKEDVSFCRHCILKIITLMSKEALKKYEISNSSVSVDDSGGIDHARSTYSDERVYTPGERQLDTRIDCSIGAGLDSAVKNVQNNVPAS